MTRTFISLAAAALALGIAAEAHADIMSRQAGTLTCNLDPGVGLVLGSVRAATCEYDHIDRRGRLVRESYTGTLNRAGIDLGITSQQTLSWTVMTPGGRNHRGMLLGAFEGASSDLTVVVGAGTRSLLNEQGIALQPVSSSGQVGLGIGFGATALELRPMVPVAYTSLAR